MEANPDDTTSARQRLLERAVEYVAEHGLGDLSLRQLASALGTSHRMLIYHFGSKEGLLVALVQEVEARQRALMAEIGAEDDVPAGEALRRMWQDLSAPAKWPHERLFFEVYGQALQGRAHTTGLLQGIVDSWLDPAEELGVRRGMPARQARVSARLGVAVIRGLLLDLLATGEHEDVRDAMELFIFMVEATSGRDGLAGAYESEPGAHPPATPAR